MANGTNGNSAVAKQEASAAATFRDQFKRMEIEIGYALPQHVPVERFMRVVLTAVNESPDLLAADRRSLLAASLKAAQDGLLPDGRDGALVVYKTNVGDRFIKKVQWMPMMGGLLKKARNSGEIKSIEAHVVREGDKFTYVLGDNPRLEHEPDLEGEGALRFAYAIAWLKDGTAIREVMTRGQIAQVRAVSKSATGPAWTKWEDEMWRKAAFRRLFKWLPKSSDLDDLIRRDDALYEFGDKAEEAAAKAAQIGMFKPVANPLADEAPAEATEWDPSDKSESVVLSNANRIAAFSDDGSVDPETGEVEEIRQEPRRAPPVIEHGESGEHATQPQKPADEPRRKVKPPSPALELPSEKMLARARESGEIHGRKRIPKSAMPREFHNAHRSVFDAWAEAYERGRAEGHAQASPKGPPRDPPAEIDL